MGEGRDLYLLGIKLQYAGQSIQAQCRLSKKIAGMPGSLGIAPVG
jgi:hypothetical protein